MDHTVQPSSGSKGDLEKSITDRADRILSFHFCSPRKGSQPFTLSVTAYLTEL